MGKAITAEMYVNSKAYKEKMAVKLSKAKELGEDKPAELEKKPLVKKKKVITSKEVATKREKKIEKKRKDADNRKMLKELAEKKKEKGTISGIDMANGKDKTVITKVEAELAPEKKKEEVKVDVHKTPESMPF